MQCLSQQRLKILKSDSQLYPLKNLNVRGLWLEHKKQLQIWNTLLSFIKKTPVNTKDYETSPVQRILNIAAQIDLDWIVCISSATLSYGDPISQCRYVPLAFPVKDVGKVLHRPQIPKPWVGSYPKVMSHTGPFCNLLHYPQLFHRKVWWFLSASFSKRALIVSSGRQDYSMLRAVGSRASPQPSPLGLVLRTSQSCFENKTASRWAFLLG